MREEIELAQTKRLIGHLEELEEAGQLDVLSSAELARLKAWDLEEEQRRWRAAGDISGSVSRRGRR